MPTIDPKDLANGHAARSTRAQRLRQAEADSPHSLTAPAVAAAPTVDD